MLINNIGLESNRRLCKQLDAYQATFRKWWSLRGPEEFLDRQMRLRCPTGDVGFRNWSEARTLAPSEYQWGIFVSPTAQSTIAFGQHQGERLWDSVPADYYYLLLDHIVMQADAENGSIEQSRALTRTVPSATDLEHLFQFFLEEGRHSWAMVHLMLEHFGQDGVVESESLLERMCGEATSPRLLNAFNHTTEDWLAHYIWCFLADRNGKYQVDAVSRGAFRPLTETTRYMLLEEPLHVRFGADGLERTIARSAEVTLERDRLDIFEFGAIPLPVIQRYLNFWSSAVYDLFGNDQSTHACNMFEIGVRVPKNFELWAERDVLIDVHAESIQSTSVPSKMAINAIMRRQFIHEVGHTIRCWNASLAASGVDFSLSLPHERFNRRVGPLSGARVAPDGSLVSPAAPFDVNAFLPSPADKAAVASLMKRETAPGKCAGWIAPPTARLKGLAVLPT